MDVEFGDAQYKQMTRPKKKSWMIEMVKKTGIVKTDNSANFLLLGLAIIFFLLTLYVIYANFLPRGIFSLTPAATETPVFESDEFAPAQEV